MIGQQTPVNLIQIENDSGVLEPPQLYAHADR